MTFPRRAALTGAAALGMGAVLAACSSEDNGASPASTAEASASPAPTTSTPSTSGAQNAVTWLMPDEGQPHERTWMSFAVSEDIWGKELTAGAREALLRISEAIGRFEPVSALLPSGSPQVQAPENVTVLEAAADDLWMRDTGPTFVAHAGEVAGVDFNFNGWGGHQEHAQDATVAAFVCEKAHVKRVSTELVLEGGALEVDGEGTAIITESCVLNENRNPGWTKERVEQELQRTLGIQKVIWLPGIAGKDITDGHTDFYARFAGPGVVVAGREDDPSVYDYKVTRTHLEILGKATDAQGRAL